MAKKEYFSQAFCEEETPAPKPSGTEQNGGDDSDSDDSDGEDD